jgi:hypothetical protein
MILTGPCSGEPRKNGRASLLASGGPQVLTLSSPACAPPWRSWLWSFRSSGRARGVRFLALLFGKLTSSGDHRRTVNPILC